jgi:hypothetical protein
MAIPALLAALGRSGAAGAGGGLPSGVGALYKQADQQAGPTSKLTDALKKMGAAAGKAHSAMLAIPGKLGQISAQWTHTLSLQLDAVKALAAPMGDLVGKSNPAAIKQFTLAVNDASAVLGRILLPIFQSLTRAARSVGDTYATLEKRFRPAMDGIAKMFDAWFTAIGNAARDNAFAIEVMAHVVGNAAQAFGWLTTQIGKVHTLVASMFGFERDPDVSGRGAAVRSVNITSRGEDVARAAQEAAFMQALGQGPKQDPVVNGLDVLAKWMEKLYEFITQRLPTIISDAAKQKVKDVGEAATGPVGGVIPGAGAVGRAALSLLTR